MYIFDNDILDLYLSKRDLFYTEKCIKNSEITQSKEYGLYEQALETSDFFHRMFDYLLQFYSESDIISKLNYLESHCGTA